MNSSSKPNIQQLFQSAHEEGTISAKSLQTLENLDLGVQIQSGLGVTVNSVKASEVILLSMLVDDSGSIRFSGNAQTVRSGHNFVLESLLASKQSSNVLVHTSYLNGHILYPFLPLSIIDENERKQSGKIVYVQNPLVEKMNGTNYNPNLGTPLYDQAVVMLGRVLAKYQEFADGGVMARTITMLITDGADQHSTRANAASVRSLVKDLAGEHHIVAGMGIDDGGNTDFRQIFRDMGIIDEWILTPGASAAEIRRAFQVFSQSAIRASQSAAQFTKQATGGLFVN